MTKETGIYRELQKHLDRMPLGYPATKDGVEIVLLKAVFSEEQAAAALYLDDQHRSLDTIHQAAGPSAPSKERLKKILDETVSKGGIFRRYRDSVPQYALMPFVLWGIFEHQIGRLDKDFLAKTGNYFQGEMGFEMATHPLPKMRVIPVEESVEAEHRVTTYDELRKLIAGAGDHITVQDCVCRKGWDLNGKSCQVTDRRELCMSFGDLADLYAEEGWGRRIDQAEALEIAQQNEAEGLVLMPSNERNPRFLCACCTDCCGMMGMMKAFPKPAEVVGSNYCGEVTTESCEGCGTCVTRCPLDAAVLKDGKSTLDLKRCIGCGVCVPTCPSQAIHLLRKAKEIVPPESLEEAFTTVREHKNSFKGKVQGALVKTLLRTVTKFSKSSGE